MNKKSLKQIIGLAFISLLLHGIWENGQAPLFIGYESFTQHFPVCFIATLGDVLITFIIVFLIGLTKNDSKWIDTSTPNDYMVLSIVGFFIAIGIEQNALLANKWAYSEMMPTLMDIGLSPLLQMTLLLPFSVYIAKKIFSNS